MQPINQSITFDKSKIERMRLNKILLAGLLLCGISSTTQAKKKNTFNDNEINQINIVEKKTGISAKHNQVLASLYKEAVEWLHTPYRYGGTSHKGIDCSALTGTIYQNVFGIHLQRSSKDIANSVKSLSKNELMPGDLVFFATSRRKKGVSHVGIYLGNNHFVHASTSNGVMISNLDETYYARTWVKGGRIKDSSKTFKKLLVQLEHPNIKLQIKTSPLLLEESSNPLASSITLASNNIRL